MEYIFLIIQKIAIWVKSPEFLYAMKVLSITGILLFIVLLFVVPISLYLYRKLKDIEIPDY
jgi:hypothetical protein